jgi:DnaJ family protein C protein 7
MSENSWEDLKEKGNSFFKQKRYEDAITFYNKALKLNPKAEVLYSNKGTCEKCLKEYKESIRDYEKALELNPKNTKNMNRLASVYIIKGQIGNAKMLQEKALNLEPNNSIFKEQMTIIEKILEDEEKLEDRIKDKKFEDAEEVCKRLIEKESDFSELKLKYIKILIENVKLTEAIQYINNEINFEDKKSNEQFDYLTALCLYYDGQYEKAKKQINLMKSKGNSIDTKDLLEKVNTIDSIKTKANEIFKQKKYEEAIEEYTKILEFDPNNKKFNSLILANRALCYQKLNKNVEALRDSNQSIKLNPFYARGYIKRGNVYMELKMFDDARADFQKAKDLDPNVAGVDGYLNDANKNAEKARKRDYYAILGIDKNADEKEIKRAYKKMAMKYHPDRNSESEESKKMAEKKFIDVNDAYSVLSDPKKRSMYDQGVDPLNPEEAGGGGVHFGGDASEILKMFFGGGGSPFGFSSGGFGNGSNIKFSFGGPGSRGGRGGGDPFSFFTSFQ